VSQQEAIAGEVPPIGSAMLLKIKELGEKAVILG
jgi:hypothetical protein